MKKKQALTVFDSKIVNGSIDSENLTCKEDIKRQIRIAADNDTGFENVVFELGCSVLAKVYEKQRDSYIAQKTKEKT